MTVSKKFILIIFLGAILIIPFIFINGDLLIFFIYNVLAFGFLIIDYFVSCKPQDISIVRCEGDKLYYKDTNKIEFLVKNNFGRTVKISAKDNFPDLHFNFVDGDLCKTISPFEEATFSYTVIPTKRGNFKFDTISIKVPGFLGLVTKYFNYSLPLEIKVYPNLRDLSKYRIIMQKNRLLEAGEKRIALQGSGTEFESLRDYVEGDDFRKINWNNTARENKLIVTQFETEKNQPIFIMVDTGRPMSYNIRGYKKLDYAINAALVLSDIVNQKGDNSGLMVFDTQVTSLISPSKGDVHRNTLMETLYNVKDTKNISDFEKAFFELTKKQKRRCVAFLFTDFETIEEAKTIVEKASIVSRKHILIIVLMKNESVLKMATKEETTLNDYYEKGAALDYLLERKKIIKILRSRGVYCIETDCENFTTSAVNCYLNIKKS